MLASITKWLIVLTTNTPTTFAKSCLEINILYMRLLNTDAMLASIDSSIKYVSTSMSLAIGIFDQYHLYQSHASHVIVHKRCLLLCVYKNTSINFMHLLWLSTNDTSYCVSTKETSYCVSAKETSYCVTFDTNWILMLTVEHYNKEWLHNQLGIYAIQIFHLLWWPSVLQCLIRAILLYLYICKLWSYGNPWKP